MKDSTANLLAIGTISLMIGIAGLPVAFAGTVMGFTVGGLVGIEVAKRKGKSNENSERDK